MRMSDTHALISGHLLGVVSRGLAGSAQLGGALFEVTSVETDGAGNYTGNFFIAAPNGEPFKVIVEPLEVIDAAEDTAALRRELAGG